MTTARRSIALLSALFLVPLIAVTTATNTASAADDAALFKPMTGFDIGKGQDVRVRPVDYRAYRVDLAGLRAQLGTGSEAQITIPDPAGTPTTFTVVEHSVMEPELQAAHPEIRTYSGADADGSSITLDVTPMGFHAFVRRPDGVTWLVDPAYNRRGENRVLSYAGGSTVAKHTFVEKELQKTVDSVAPVAAGSDFSTPGGPVSQRTYRMAFVTDPTYASYFGTANVFAEKATMMARVNDVYNDDLAIQFLLVTGTDTKLNLDTAALATLPNGPCGANACYSAAQLANCNSTLLTRNNFVTGMLIGAENFDIGHIGLGNAGGGVAQLSSVGGPNKSRGCTGLPTPDGDLYAIDYVAHEVGHQMGGNHTFNSSVCAGNRNAGTSVEPGSGTSVMAYAGICGSDNLQPHSDPYFSQRSVDEINAVTAAAPGSSGEQQVVSLATFDGTDSFTISCTGCGTSATVTNGSTYNAGQLATEILAVTGEAAAVTGYDGGAFNTNGFTVTWAPGFGDEPKLTITPVTGAFTTFTGTLVNGGPHTNQGLVTVSGNSSPVVSAPALGDKSIPSRTPFALTGSATDPNGDTLTYMWEQNNPGSSSESLTSNAKTAGPLFRQFGLAANVSETDTLEYHSPGENLAGTSPTRTFPDLAQILAGNTNAATGSCPVAPPPGQTTVDCFSEFLPTDGYVGAPATRAMNFRLSVRDEFTPDGAPDDPGGLSTANVVVTVVKGTGPFQVTSRATAGSPASGAETVTWDVNGTNTAALATNVKISLSTDSGLTYPTVLAASTPNDGSQLVALPSITTVGNTARIKVEAVGKYFFDINDANFAIVPSGPNTAPTVNAGPDGASITGSLFTSSGSYTDDVPATVTATVDYGDGGGQQPLTLNTGAQTFALSHTYATPGNKTITVEVTDAGALTATDTATVVVTAANVAPTVNAGPDVAAVVGSPFSSSGSFTDETPATATATVDYGDGAGAQPLTLTGSTFNLSHTYTTVGAKTVTVTVTDGAALSGTDSATVTVSKASSAVDAKAEPKKITQGHKFKVKATVTTTPGVPTGTVQVYLGTKLLGTGTLKSNGKVTIKIPEKKAKKLKVGKNTLTAKYLGSATVAPSQDDFVIKVKQA